MSKQAVGITGGIFVIIGLAGMFALWWFHIKVVMENATFWNEMYILFLMSEIYNVIPSMPIWYIPIIPGFLFGDLVLYMMAINTLKPPILYVNFWNIVTIPFDICMIVLMCLIGLGVIMALSGVEEK
jgi:hypothetical protein